MGRRLARVCVRASGVLGVRAECYAYSDGFAPGIAPHAHEDLQVCYSTDGGGYVRTGRKWREAPPNHVHVFPANEEHTAARDADVEKAATYHVLYIAPRLLTSAREEGSRAVLDGADGRGGPGDLRAIGATRQLLGAIWTDPDPSVAEDAAVVLLTAIGHTRVCTGRDRGLASRIRDVLLCDTTKCVSLADLAALTGTTPHRARSVFKNNYGVPPARYHLLQRLTTARSLLLAGQPLADVAHTTGFVDQAHLTNRMRRYFGHAPGMIVRT